MRVASICLFLVLTFPASGVRAETAGGEWQFDLVPYVWLPVIDGTLKYNIPPGGSGSPNVEVGPTDWLDLLNYGLLLNGTARKGRFLLSSDLVILSMTSKNDGRVVSVGPGSGAGVPVSATINADTRSDLDGLILSLAAGYALQQSDEARLDGFAGVRYFGVDASTRWNLTADITLPMGPVILPSEGSIGSDKDLWDFIVGLRGYTRLGGSKWFVPYYLDVGTGDSELSWNALAGIGYEYGWGDLLFTYRHLSYDQGSDRLLNDFNFSGLAIGARFRFR